jgi:hypothetical protein
MNRKEDYTEKMRGASEEKCKENMQRAHVQEQKEERIVNLRDKLLRAFECAAEDHRLLVEELRETQDTVRSIE